MNFFKKVYNFFKNLFSRPEEEVEEFDNLMGKLEKTGFPLEKLAKMSIEMEENERINKIKGARTWLNKLYNLEQAITVFEESFPSEYQKYLEKIEKLREDYITALKNVSSELTFELNPEIDFEYSGKIVKLEKDIQKFIETEVKFDIISKRLHRLIKKLNILYNVSILYSDYEEKEKINSQLESALESEKKILNEFKKCYHLLNDEQIKESILNLISYIDYQIFKTSIRVSNQDTNEIAAKLVTITEFESFDYISAFEDFLKDEISDLNEVLPLLGDEYRKIFAKKFKKFLTDLTYSERSERKIFDLAFWKSFFENESNLIQMLKSNGVEKEKAKVNLIKRMNISVDDSDVVVLPKTNTYLSLTSLFTKTNNIKILLLLKTLKNISNEVTYKEIYFLLQLFELDDLIKNESNELYKYLQKYFARYSYNEKTINSKKEQVKYLSTKEYVKTFSLDEYEDDIMDTIVSLNIDFKVDGNDVYMNSFYFNGLENVLKSLQNNT